MGLVSHGNLRGPIKGSRQLGLTPILPTLLSSHVPLRPSPVASRSNIQQSEPLSRPQSCQADGHTVPVHPSSSFFFFTDLPSAEDMHAYPRYCIHTHQERRTHLLRRRVQTARCRVLSLASPAGLDQMAGEYKRGVLLLSLYLSECTIVIMAPLNCHSGFIKVEGVCRNSVPFKRPGAIRVCNYLWKEGIH